MHRPEVGGSNPPSATKNNVMNNRIYYLAQEYLGEQQPQLPEWLTPDDICVCVQNILRKLHIYGGISQQTCETQLRTLDVKIHNGRDSYVEVCDGIYSARSDHEGRLIDLGRPADKEDIEVLINALLWGAKTIQI